MVVVELLGFFDSKIQQLHLDVALDPPIIIYQVVAPTEKAPELLPFLPGYVDAVQTTVLIERLYGWSHRNIIVS